MRNHPMNASNSGNTWSDPATRNWQPADRAIDRALTTAGLAGDLAKVQQLVSEGANIEAVDSGEKTLLLRLMSAQLKWSLADEAMKQLVAGRIAVAVWLVGQGADLAPSRSKGMPNALHMLVRERRYWPALPAFLAAPTAARALQQQISKGGTPLHEAFRMGLPPDAFVQMVAAGADPDARLERVMGFDTAPQLGWSVRWKLRTLQGHDEYTQALAAYEARQRMQAALAGAPVAGKTQSGPTQAMLKAIELHDHQAAIAALEQGADPDALAYTGQTALQRVLRQPAPYRVDPESEARAKADPTHLYLHLDEPPSRIEGALDLPLRDYQKPPGEWWRLPNPREASALVKAMIAAEVDPNQVSAKEPRTPLQMAIATRQWAACVPLLQAGADPNARSRYGSTPTHDALRLDAPMEVYHALLVAGADFSLPWTRERGQGPSVAQLLAKELAADHPCRSALALWQARAANGPSITPKLAP